MEDPVQLLMKDAGEWRADLFMMWIQTHEEPGQTGVCCHTTHSFYDPFSPCVSFSFLTLPFMLCHQLLGSPPPLPPSLSPSLVLQYFDPCMSRLPLWRSMWATHSYHRIVLECLNYLFKGSFQQSARQFNWVSKTKTKNKWKKTKLVFINGKASRLFFPFLWAAV